MVLWKKTMVLWTKLWYYRKKLWYYTENYGTSIYERKNMVNYQKTKKLLFIMENTMVIYQNN